LPLFAAGLLEIPANLLASFKPYFFTLDYQGERNVPFCLESSMFSFLVPQY